MISIMILLQIPKYVDNNYKKYFFERSTSWKFNEYLTQKLKNVRVYAKKANLSQIQLFTSQIQQGNKITMMTNTNNYSSRNGQMSTSSMFFPRNSQQSKFDSGFTSSNNIYDPFAKSKQLKMEESNAKMFPRGLASHSMIDMNSTSTSRRVPFGKLDSMARVVTPAFRQDSLNQPKKSQDSTAFHSNITAQSVINQGSNSYKKIQNTFETNYMQPETNSPILKKRRESIDLGIASKRQHNNQIPLFLRKNKDSEQSKNQTKQINEANILPGDFKNKNFEFLKKRREVMQNHEPSMTGSIIGVQSMKVLPNHYNLNEPTIKKPEFLSPNQNKFTNHISPIMCPQDRQKNQGVAKDEFHGKSPNFQFKKKKLFDSPVELASPKNLMSKQSLNSKKELLTLKQKMAMKNMREIKLQDFDILEKLGKGAFGDVFIAQQKSIGFICVIKKMSKKRIRQAKVEQHILREIKIQTYLSYLSYEDHKHLTNLFGYFHDADNLYLVLQALPDGSLQNVKKKKKLPQKQTATIVRQVALGLKSMHDQYLIHRDLKPENIFMNDGIAKIGDFGCSIYNKYEELRNTVVGCLQYSSPEQLSKEGYSEKIDSWSLGILTFELLFGRSPFESDIIKIAKNKELKPQLSTLNFPQGIPIKNETRQFIENLLSQDPDSRMDMDQALHHEFLREDLNKKGPKAEQFEFNDII